jgi:hypothetical protein
MIAEDRSATRGEVAPAIDCCWVNVLSKMERVDFLHRAICRWGLDVRT